MNARTITAQEMLELQRTGKSLDLIDVRTPWSSTRSMPKEPGSCRWIDLIRRK